MAAQIIVPLNIMAQPLPTSRIRTNFNSAAQTMSFRMMQLLL